MIFKPWGSKGALRILEKFYADLFACLKKRNFGGISKLYPDNTVIITRTSDEAFYGKQGAVKFWRGVLKSGEKIHSFKIKRVHSRPVEALVRVDNIFLKNLEIIYYLATVTHEKQRGSDPEDWLSGNVDHKEECILSGIHESYNF
jgi:hypothetical protein